ncbi:MAG: NIPSNAP family protein, partial [Sciscionella sp.]
SARPGRGAMITCCIRYTIDPWQLDEFERYATTWPPIIDRCGGRLVGYYLPCEGANNVAVALIDFASLSAYERYRAALAADPDARANIAKAAQVQAIRAERRSFFRRV